MGVFGILKKKTLVYLEAPKSPSCPLTLLPPCLSATEAFEATTHEPNLLKLAKDQEAAPPSLRRMIAAPCFAVKSKAARSRLIREQQRSMDHPKLARRSRPA